MMYACVLYVCSEGEMKTTCTPRIIYVPIKHNEASQKKLVSMKEDMAVDLQVSIYPMVQLARCSLSHHVIERD